MKTALRLRHAIVSGNRLAIIERLLTVYRGAPLGPTDIVPPEVRSFLRLCVGEFVMGEFLHGRGNLRVKQGHREAPYTAETVGNWMRERPDIPVVVANGMFRGKVFPSPQTAIQVFSRVSPVPNNQKKMLLWVFDNLASSSFFEDLWEGFEALKTGGPIVACPTCNKNPCVVFDAHIKGPWKTVASQGRLGRSNKQLRFRCYTILGKARGRNIRTPMNPCHLLAIRFTFPGDDDEKIVGFHPHPIFLGLAQEVQQAEEAEDDDHHSSDSEEEESEEHEALPAAPPPAPAPAPAPAFTPAPAPASVPQLAPQRRTRRTPEQSQPTSDPPVPQTVPPPVPQPAPTQQRSYLRQRRVPERDPQDDDDSDVDNEPRLLLRRKRPAPQPAPAEQHQLRRRRGPDSQDD